MALDRLTQVTSSGITTTISFRSNGINVSGAITATSFVGDGSGLTGVVGSGSGVVVLDGGSTVGTAATINFGANLSVSPISGGIVTVTGSSAYANSDVDTHLNTSTASSGEVLSWNGSDYDWVAQSGGSSDVVSDTTPQLGGNLDLNSKNITGTGNVNITGIITATTLSASGANLTSLNASNLGSGTIPDARFPATLPAISGANLTNVVPAYTSTWTLTGNGSAYFFSGNGFDGTETNPEIYLVRGQKYRFNASASHPFQIQSTVGSGGTAYSDGVTNNNSAAVDFDVQYDAPDTLYYQCTNHVGMAGTIYITPKNEPAVGTRNTLTHTTSSVGSGNTVTFDMTGYKSYGLLKVGISSASWLRLYTDGTSRSNDQSRIQGVDPSPDAGVIAEVISVGSTTVLMSPGVIGWNNDSTTSTTIYGRITNTSASAASSGIGITLTVVKLEN